MANNSNNYNGIVKRYENAISVRAQYTSTWREISKYTGIKLDDDYFNTLHTDKAKILDEYIEDPTSAISVNQFANYLIGVIWGTGQDILKLKPSRWVLEKVAVEDVQSWYDYASDQTLYHMNHERSGLARALQSHAYSQGAYGTSGIGAFVNQAFKKGIDENALLFREYGVDNIAIGEGPAGAADYVYIRYNWTATRIVNEFCFDKGAISDLSLRNMPKKIQDAWNTQDEQREFQLVCCIFPRDDFNPRLKGKKGTRYKGVWFLDDERTNIFHEDDYKDNPIPVARINKIRGEIYGRADATIIISTIRALNFIVSNTIEILEKMSDPPIGMWDGTAGGDNVIDTSSRGITPFNPSLSAGQAPTWQLFDIGDPSGVINFLIPYLKEHITTASRVDTLLDFSSSQQMTATESLQRYAIRGKSLSGLLITEKNELLSPLTKRCVNSLWDLNELGIRFDDPRVESLEQGDRTVIPEAIVQVANEGKPFFEIEFNNELENLTRTQNIERLLQFIQAVQAASSIDPDMLQSTNMYDWLQEVFSNLSITNPMMVGKIKFEDIKKEIADQRKAMMQAQVGQAGATAEKDLSQANKNNAEAQNG